MAGAAGYQGQRGAARDAGPGVGGVGSGGLVPHVNHPYAGASGLGERFIEVVPHQGEDAVDAQLYNRTHEQHGPVWHSMAILLQSLQSP